MTSNNWHSVCNDDDLSDTLKNAWIRICEDKEDNLIKRLNLKTVDDAIDAAFGGVYLQEYFPVSVETYSEGNSTVCTITERYRIREDWGPDSVEEMLCFGY